MVTYFTTACCQCGGHAVVDVATAYEGRKRPLYKQRRLVGDGDGEDWIGVLQAPPYRLQRGLTDRW